MKFKLMLFTILFGLSLLVGMYFPISLDNTMPNLVAKTLPAIVELRPGFGHWMGAGVLISDDGWIVTAKHVVENQDVMIAITFNGEKFMSTLIVEDSDPNTDIALVKIDIENASYVKLGTQYPRLGSLVYTLGHPLGIFNSVSLGIISNIHINEPPFGLDLILIDAEITGGNSGGGLFDMRGHLVGIVVAGTNYYTGIEMNLVVPITRGERLLREYLEQEIATNCDNLGMPFMR